jgi:hypothetical protein
MGDTTTALNIKVVSMGGSEYYFKVKPTTRLTKVLHACAAREGVNPISIRLMFDGQRVPCPGMETPAQCEMEEGDVIDMVYEQQGGCVASPVPALFRRDAVARPGLAFLDGTAALEDGSSADVRRLINEVGGSLEKEDAPRSVPALLDAQSCAMLACLLHEAAARDAIHL